MTGFSALKSPILARAFVWAALAACAPIAIGAAWSQVKAITEPQDMNIAGLTGEITEAKRKDGVLTIRLRLKNTSDKDVASYLVEHRNFDAWHVIADKKKYFVLRDAEKTPLMPHADSGGFVRVHIKKGAAYTFWAKFPAPPAEVKKVTFMTPLSPPFEDVPLSD